jgi:hypothetical protein
MARRSPNIGLWSDRMAQMTLEERVDRLESIDAIKRLKAVYCMYCDAKYDADGICSLFVEDGVWDGGPSFGRYEGHQQIHSFFKGISGDILFAAHLVLNPIITIVLAADGGCTCHVRPSTIRAQRKDVGYYQNMTRKM